MKNILIKEYSSGKYGHASTVVNTKTGIEIVQVRMLESYESVHICNLASFYIYYEVLDVSRE